MQDIPGGCRTWSVEAKIGPSEDSFCRICSPIARLWGKKTVFSKSGEAKNGPLWLFARLLLQAPTASELGWLGQRQMRQQQGRGR
jgi:hypothetical protein